MIDTRHNPANEIVKYKFFEELANAHDGKDHKTVTMYVNALHVFEVATGFKDFKKFTSDWAITFKNHLNDKRNQRTGQPISKSCYMHYISFVRQFFEWLIENQKDYAKIKRRDIDYLNVTRNDKNKARATNFQESHDVADILTTIRAMPESSEIERRNKAMLSLFLLCSPRIASLQEARIDRIKYFKDYDAWAFVQDPRLQNTKFSKNITTFFVGNCEDIAQNVIRWRDELTSKGFKGKDYLFPKITPNFDVYGQSIMLISKDYIHSETQVREIVKEAFAHNGLPYYKPHSFRHSIARLIRKELDATNKLIALAENLGQKNGMATLITSYAGDPLQVRAQVMKKICLE